MAGFEVYRAVANAARALEVAATASPFTIEVRFLGGLNDAQRQAFTAAADRWATVIVGDLPAVTVDGEEIDDVRIDASGIAIDGPEQILGQAGPTLLRPASAGAAAGLPVTGTMEFDTADLAEMERAGTLRDVITHEMGHVLGLGSIWTRKNLLRGSGTANPRFTGAGAVAAYAALRAGTQGGVAGGGVAGGGVAPGNERGGTAVPVEGTGGPGTRDAHWRESVFGDELMTGYVGSAGNPLSRLSVASMADLGYQVDLVAAEPYVLPTGPVRVRGSERHARLRTTVPELRS